MFEFLHLPELTDKYFRSLFFVFSLVVLFFASDHWLLAKDPTAFRRDIKLTDFFISRLRFMIPLMAVMVCVFLARYGTFEKAYFYGMVFTSCSLYLSVIAYKYIRPHSLKWYLSLFLGLCVFETLMDEHLIAAFIGFLIYCALSALILNAVEKAKDKEEKKIRNHQESS